MTDTERLDSLANLLYRMQWDSKNVEAMNEILDGMLGDPGYAPGLRFRELLDRHMGDHRPTFTLNASSAAHDERSK